jgi:hypothetical protein
MLKAGDTVEMPKPGLAIPHLWIIITDPEPHNNLSIIVNVTTLRSHSDTTVVLKAGDHPYIVHDSCMFYADARLTRPSEIEKAINLGVCRKRQPCSDALLERIKKGLLTSEQTKNKVRKFFSQALGVLCPYCGYDHSPATLHRLDEKLFRCDDCDREW